MQGIILTSWIRNAAVQAIDVGAPPACRRKIVRCVNVDNDTSMLVVRDNEHRIDLHVSAACLKQFMTTGASQPLDDLRGGYLELSEWLFRTIAITARGAPPAGSAPLWPYDVVLYATKVRYLCGAGTLDNKNCHAVRRDPLLSSAVSRACSSRLQLAMPWLDVPSKDDDVPACIHVASPAVPYRAWSLLGLPPLEEYRVATGAAVHASASGQSVDSLEARAQQEQADVESQVASARSNEQPASVPTGGYMDTNMGLTPFTQWGHGTAPGHMLASAQGAGPGAGAAGDHLSMTPAGSSANNGHQGSHASVRAGMPSGQSAGYDRDGRQQHEAQPRGDGREGQLQHYNDPPETRHGHAAATKKRPRVQDDAAAGDGAGGHGSGHAMPDPSNMHAELFDAPGPALGSLNPIVSRRLRARRAEVEAENWGVDEADTGAQKDDGAGDGHGRAQDGSRHADEEHEPRAPPAARSAASPGPTTNEAFSSGGIAAGQVPGRPPEPGPAAISRAIQQQPTDASNDNTSQALQGCAPAWQPHDWLFAGSAVGDSGSGPGSAVVATLMSVIQGVTRQAVHRLTGRNSGT